MANLDIKHPVTIVRHKQFVISVLTSVCVVVRRLLARYKTFCRQNVQDVWFVVGGWISSRAKNASWLIEISKCCFSVYDQHKYVAVIRIMSCCNNSSVQSASLLLPANEYWSHGAISYSSDSQPGVRVFQRVRTRIFRGYYYRYSALGPVWAETRAQSGDWYGSGKLHPGQVLRGSLPLLSPAFRLSHFRHQVPPCPPRCERS